MSTKKELISLNTSTPPSYSGWLGSAWFEHSLKGTDAEAIAEEAKRRNAYIEEIKQGHINVILKNKLENFEILGNTIIFSRESDKNLYAYALTFANGELPDLLRRTLGDKAEDIIKSIAKALLIEDMPKEQQELFKRELKMHGCSDNLEEHDILLTDEDSSQYQIALGEDTYIFTQADYRDPENETFEDFRAEYAKFSDYTKDEINSFIHGYYDSIEKLKEECPNKWEMIALECGFEKEMV